MAAIPFTVELTLSIPPDAGQDLAPVQYSYSGTVNSAVEYKLDLTGSGTKTLDFGTAPAAGAKFILVKVEPAQGVAPVLVRPNGGTVAEEVSSGGAKMLCSPAPSAGITSMTLEYTSDATVRVWVLG